jgi:hypothetical protein
MPKLRVKPTVSEKEFGEPYPDFEAQGRVVQALQLSLRSLGSLMVVTGSGAARVEKGERFSQVYTKARERLFLYDFWDQIGVLHTPCRGGVTVIQTRTLRVRTVHPRCSI